MLKTLVNQSQRWDNIVYQHATMQAVKTALQQLRPCSYTENPDCFISRA
ncbi:Protein of unknown function [Leuconostoc citreum]|nr:Protein of unknown function [Leuconostoc citreum]